MSSLSRHAPRRATAPYAPCRSRPVPRLRKDNGTTIPGSTTSSSSGSTGRVKVSLIRPPKIESLTLKKRALIYFPARVRSERARSRVRVRANPAKIGIATAGGLKVRIKAANRCSWLGQDAPSDDGVSCGVRWGYPPVDGFALGYVTSDGAQARIPLVDAWALRLEAAPPVRSPLVQGTAAFPGPVVVGRRTPGMWV